MTMEPLLRRQFLLTVAAITLVPGRPLPASGTNLEEIRAIEEMLVAPCCWRQPISTHQTREAEAIRSEVRQLVVAGKGRQEILAALVEKYGTRILAAPPARGFNLLAYLLPPVSLACGVLSIAFFIHRALSRRRTGSRDAVVRQDADMLTVYRSRIEAELQALNPPD